MFKCHKCNLGFNPKDEGDYLGILLERTLTGETLCIDCLIQEVSDTLLKLGAITQAGQKN